MIKKNYIFLFFVLVFVARNTEATARNLSTEKQSNIKTKANVENSLDGVERVVKIENKNHDGVVRVKRLEKIDYNDIIESDDIFKDKDDSKNNKVDNKSKINKNSENGKSSENSKNIDNNKSTKNSKNKEDVPVKPATNNIKRLHINKPVVITTNTGNNKIINTTNTVVVNIDTATGNIKNRVEKNTEKNTVENTVENTKTDTEPETIEIKISSDEIEAIRLNTAKSSSEFGVNNSTDNKNTSQNPFELPKIATPPKKVDNNQKQVDNNKNITEKPTKVIKNQQLAITNENNNKNNQSKENRARQVISTKVADPKENQKNKNNKTSNKININDIDNRIYRRNYDSTNSIGNSRLSSYSKIENKDNDRIIPKIKVIKNSNYSNSNFPNNLKIINKIEQNLMYNDNLKSKTKIDIKKGDWVEEDLVETEEDKFGITRTSKRIEAESTETERDATIAKLKDLAYEATKMREYEIAVKLYKQVLRLNKNDNFAKLSLATSYHMLGQYVQAKPIYIELLPIFPNSEQLASNLLSIIIQESPYEAIYLLPALASKYNTSAKIQAQTSIAFTSVERYDMAIKYIQKAINLDEGNYEYKYNLAVLYDLTKRYSQAYSLYKELYDISQVEKSLPSRKIKERLTQLKKYI